MDVVNAAWLSGLVLGTAYLTSSYKTQFAFNIPYHLGCIALALTGLLLILVSFISSRFASNTSTLSIPLHDGSKSPRSPKSPRSNDVRSLRSLSEPMRPADARSLIPGRRRVWDLFMALVATVCVRLEAARWVINHTECASIPFAPALPLLVAFVQCMTNQEPLVHPARRIDDSFLNTLAASRWRNVVPAVLLSLGSFAVISAFPELRSSYICAQSYTSYQHTIPRFQIIGTLLDVLIILMLDRMIARARELRRLPPVQRLADPGWAALTAYMISTVIGLFAVLPIKRYWFTQMPLIYILSAIKMGAAFAFTTLCALQVYRRTGVTATTIMTSFVAINVASLATARAAPSYDLPVSSFKVIFSLFIIFAGFLLYLSIDAIISSGAGTRYSRSPEVSRRLLLFLGLLFLVQTLVWIRQPSARLDSHPIPTLMKEADQAFQRWMTQAGRSRTVKEAAKEYRKRYKRDPPPRFDKWFDFARERKSVVIDDFDGMHEDLLPFWSLSPGDIRLRAFESMSNNWNFMGGILIRKGKMQYTTHLPENHKWMLEGMGKMIQPFVHHLPDMDIAFNVNDEPRSAVYWHEMQGRLAIGNDPHQLPPRDSGDFHPDRSWIPVPGESIEETRYRDATFRNTFYTYGSVACHPESRARVERHWNLRNACAECKAEHSRGPFVANWTAAADPCHQPDLADAHGLHLSPATFRGSNELMPVFSQSKTPGYHDLLHPSPWNYVDKTSYAPTDEEPDFDFDDKQNTLFWRGSATDGMSAGSGAWRGMLRQRLVHLVNNASDAERALVYLPRKEGSDTGYTYRAIAPSVLRDHLATDVALIAPLQRCGFSDCAAQELEFAPAAQAKRGFQEHWRYKYLLDLDGAGFSGRFLPFLRSHSLPFKAGLSREWWHPRVFAWRHFVPLDVRFSELWSLLAWFAGYPADRAGGGWLLRPHDEAAAAIASQGREWAARALRNEDMEVYMFRLLLEYGRLTDDRRDELGWMDDRD